MRLVTPPRRRCTHKPPLRHRLSSRLTSSLHLPLPSLRPLRQHRWPHPLRLPTSQPLHRPLRLPQLRLSLSLHHNCMLPPSPLRCRLLLPRRWSPQLPSRRPTRLRSSHLRGSQYRKSRSLRLSSLIRRRKQRQSRFRGTQLRLNKDHTEARRGRRVRLQGAWLRAERRREKASLSSQLCLVPLQVPIRSQSSLRPLRPPRRLAAIRRLCRPRLRRYLSPATVRLSPLPPRRIRRKASRNPRLRFRHSRLSYRQRPCPAPRHQRQLLRRSVCLCPRQCRQSLPLLLPRRPLRLQYKEARRLEAPLYRLSPRSRASFPQQFHRLSRRRLRRLLPRRRWPPRHQQQLRRLRLKRATCRLCRSRARFLKFRRRSRQSRPSLLRLQLFTRYSNLSCLRSACLIRLSLRLLPPSHSSAAGLRLFLRSSHRPYRRLCRQSRLATLRDRVRIRRCLLATRRHRWSRCWRCRTRLS